MKDAQVITAADVAAGLVEIIVGEPEPPVVFERRAMLDADGKAERFVVFKQGDTATLEAFGNPPLASDEVQHGDAWRDGAWVVKKAKKS